MQYETYSKNECERKKILLKPGNFIVTHSSNFFDVLIHIFTNSYWNHAALIVSADGTIIELEEGGIQRRTLKEYTSKEYHLVDIELSNEDRQHVVAYAHYMLKKHTKYGVLTVISIVFKILTRSRLVIKLDGTLICSEFVAQALAQGGIIWDKDTSLITPGDLYRKFVHH